MPVNDADLSRQYPFVSSVFNRILNNSGLDSFYQKLYNLKKGNGGTVSIVHIGDSHIQADFLSGVVRDGLQQFFGNAGRGLVFPYQLAQSNAPADIMSSSDIKWEFNRLAHPEIPINYGISGFGIRTSASAPTINISLRSGATFDRLRFFTDSNSRYAWLWQMDNSDMYAIKNDSLPYLEITLDAPLSSINLSTIASGATKEFYGVSLEKSTPGLIYHTIGVNGARYDQYNIADLFWQQLPALKADLFIISLGTNEAQRAAFSETAFYEELNSFLEKLKKASPGVSVLISTAPDSYKARRYNTVLKQLNTSLTAWCNKNYIPVWDLYRITNGYGSAYSWARRGLMSRDRVHFTSAGYGLQGNLLLSALAKGYNGFLSRY